MIGKQLEKKTSNIFKKAMFEDFVIDELSYSDSKKKGKEYADLLLVFGDTLVIFQEKTRAIGEHKKIEDREEIGRIETKIEEAVGQVKSSLNQLSINNIISLKTTRGIEIKLDLKGFSNIIGIVIIDAINKDGATQIDKLEICNGFQEKYDIPIHIFKITDLENIVAELDTFPDFYAYLEKREEIIKSGKLLYYVGELDLLATYLVDEESISKILNDEQSKFIIEPGIWESLNEKGFNNEYREYIRSSYCIDNIIDYLHTSIGYKVNDSMTNDYEGSTEGYLRVTYELARLNRITRKSIGDVLISKAKKATMEKFGYSFVVIPEIESSLLLLSFNGLRAERRMFLYSLCSSAYTILDHLSKGVKCNKVIGLATDPINCRTPSYDAIILANAEFKNKIELVEQAYKYFNIKREEI